MSQRCTTANRQSHSRWSQCHLFIPDSKQTHCQGECSLPPFQNPLETGCWWQLFCLFSSFSSVFLSNKLVPAVAFRNDVGYFWLSDVGWVVQMWFESELESSWRNGISRIRRMRQKIFNWRWMERWIHRKWKILAALLHSLYKPTGRCAYVNKKRANCADTKKAWHLQSTTPALCFITESGFACMASCMGCESMMKCTDVRLFLHSHKRAWLEG